MSYKRSSKAAKYALIYLLPAAVACVPVYLWIAQQREYTRLASAMSVQNVGAQAAPLGSPMRLGGPGLGLAVAGTPAPATRGAVINAAASEEADADGSGAQQPGTGNPRTS